MISLKRYLDSHQPAAEAGPSTSLLDAYRSALTAMGMCAVKAIPGLGDDLQRTLTGLGRELSESSDGELLARTESGVTQALQHWGDQAHENLQQKTGDVKELLVVLARTAATIASSDTRYSKQFDDFTARLERIANLEDLTQVRRSLVRSAAELKSCVEQMSKSTRDSVAQLQADVVTYQTKLEETEQLASRDGLTGLFNRAKIVKHVEERMAAGRPFSVAMIDLNGFKQVNDRLGHAAGDDLLKQFSTELRSNARPSDLVCRWGGDEFLLVLDCTNRDAAAHIERIQKWVVGDYTIEGATGRQKVHLDAAIGLGEWAPGKTMRDVVGEADAAMYKKKGDRR